MALAVPTLHKKLGLLALVSTLTFLALLFFRPMLRSASAAQCGPNECKGPGQYVCQYGTMCCTGGGCPSYVCVRSGCTFFGGSYCVGCSARSYNPAVCGPMGLPTPCCVNWTYCSDVYRTGGTCSYCGGGPNPPGPSCTWGGSIAAPTCSQANGLRGEYYRDNPAGNPRFDGGLKLVRNDATVQFNWGTGDPGAGLCGDHFSARWSGYVETPTSGSLDLLHRLR